MFDWLNRLVGHATSGQPADDSALATAITKPSLFNFRRE